MVHFNLPILYFLCSMFSGVLECGCHFPYLILFAAAVLLFFRFFNNKLMNKLNLSINKIFITLHEGKDLRQNIVLEFFLFLLLFFIEGGYNQQVLVLQKIYACMVLSKKIGIHFTFPSSCEIYFEPLKCLLNRKKLKPDKNSYTSYKTLKGTYLHKQI